MPPPEEILSVLKEIANDWQFLAILWHIYFAVLASVLVLGIRSSMRLVGLGLVLPLVSVSALAWASGNPFNGIFFTFSGAALLFISFRLPRDDIQIAPLWAKVIGAIMFTFGWVYPHFLETASFFPYLYSAPTGLIPCPTLSMVIGLSIIVGSFGVRAWSIVLGLSGTFYGVFGAAHLSVSLDWVLLLGALAVILTVSKDKKRDRKHAAI
ncbi:hypothetical protein [Sedimenticola selenatireducens]|uniref:Uncharacterized protein n=1 Tax=Sedimenticola selenatireducens TaxID=191960 RepID=A0A2N6CYZ9_9GAMM|nr:hypothetical protein [Sedimenticola selenatireducens]PLX62602.1 MAG: hypothetical protein C0630_05155 [Sedimenticola selenatireducens]